jgi:formyltetrahydrofolate-dependent phosphoribosylglycinamide formyltransferase
LFLDEPYVFSAVEEVCMPREQKTPFRLVVLISGNGTNLQAVLDACAAGELPARVVAVISNRRAAYGLVRAERAGVPAVYRPLKPYTDSGRARVDYDRDLAHVVASYDPDLVVLAGWMHVLSPAFIDRFPGRLINLHPALPGTFAGTHAIERAYAAFQSGEIEHSGVMVHHVVAEVDAGPVIDSAIVPILPADLLEEFEARMHEHERLVLVRATARVLSQLPTKQTSGIEPSGSIG